MYEHKFLLGGCRNRVKINQNKMFAQRRKKKFAKEYLLSFHKMKRTTREKNYAYNLTSVTHL